MELIPDNLDQKVNKIHFKSSVTELLDNQTRICIKSILNMLDVTVKDGSDKSILRKVILDNVNELERTSKEIISSPVKPDSHNYPTRVIK